jgi:hypothetical protein
MGKAAKYPASSYQSLYDPNLGSLWTSEKGLGLEEDGDHYSPERDFFEWWYFDATLDRGYRLVAILHSSLYNAVDHKPTLDIRLTPPGGPSIVAIARFERDDFHSRKEYCDVQLGDCRAFLQEPGRYHLSLRQGPIMAELVYEAIAPGWRAGTGFLFNDLKSGHYFRWVVPVPQALVSGYIVLEGQKFPVMGTGYHDHNWGNFFLPDAFSHWYWGRLSSRLGEDNWAVIFGDVVGRGTSPAYVRPFLLVKDGKVISRAPQVQVVSKGSRLEERTGISFPEKLHIFAGEEDYRAKTSMCAGSVIEAVDFARSPFRRRLPRQVSEMVYYLAQGKPVIGELSKRLLGKSSYLRLHAEAALDLEKEGQLALTGEAIYEVMQFWG